jgi:hypothetical protein
MEREKKIRKAKEAEKSRKKEKTVGKSFKLLKESEKTNQE